MKIKDFQKLSRLEQIRVMVADRIRTEGYTLEDFKKEYRASHLDCLDFITVRTDIELEGI